MFAVPKGYKLKRIGHPVKGERIVVSRGEVVVCQGHLHTRCTIVEPIEPVETIEHNHKRREKDAVTT